MDLFAVNTAVSQSHTKTACVNDTRIFSHMLLYRETIEGKYSHLNHNKIIYTLNLLAFLAENIFP